LTTTCNKIIAPNNIVDQYPAVVTEKIAFLLLIKYFFFLLMVSEPVNCQGVKSNQTILTIKNDLTVKKFPLRLIVKFQ